MNLICIHYCKPSDQHWPHNKIPLINIVGGGGGSAVDREWNRGIGQGLCFCMRFGMICSVPQKSTLRFIYKISMLPPVIQYIQHTLVLLSKGGV